MVIPNARKKRRAEMTSSTSVQGNQASQQDDVSAAAPVSEKGTFHLHLPIGSVAPWVIVVGPPYRARMIAEMMDFAHMICDPFHRGYLGYTGMCNGMPLTVVSHGIGGSSIGCVIDDLVQAGGRVFIRVGSCATLQPNPKPGDIAIVTSGDPTHDGVTQHWIEDAGDILTSESVNIAILAAAKMLVQDNAAHVGKVATISCFREGQSRPGLDDEVPEFQQDRHTQRLVNNILVYEMEATALGSRLKSFEQQGDFPEGLHWGCVLAIYANRTTDEIKEGAGDQEAITVALGAMQALHGQLNMPDYTFPDFSALEYQFDTREIDGTLMRVIEGIWFALVLDHGDPHWRSIGSVNFIAEYAVRIYPPVDPLKDWEVWLADPEDDSKNCGVQYTFEQPGDAFNKAVELIRVDQE